MQELFIVLPEMLLGGLSLLIILFSMFVKDRIYVSNFGLLGLIGICISVWIYTKQIESGSVDWIENFNINFHIIAIKQITILLAGLVILTFIGIQHLHNDQSSYYFNKVNYFAVEYVVLILLSCLGIFCVISSKDFITLFVSLELQAFCGYILTAIDRDKKMASEAAVKYFIIGSVASCFSLFGMSMLYAATGSINYDVIQADINSYGGGDIIYNLAGMFIVGNLCFKLGNSPFHAVILDVYQGAPLYSLNFISGVQKIAAIAALVILAGLFEHVTGFIEIIEFIASLSLFVGGIGGLKQTSFKRLLGYSAILNSGFILMAAVNNIGKYNTELIAYIIIYVANMIGVVSLTTFVSTKEDVLIKDLSGLARNRPFVGWGLVVLILSLMGLPPLGGFFIKFYIFQLALASGQLLFCISAVIASCIGAYYYLNVVKTIILDDATSSTQAIRQVNNEFIFAISTTSAICLMVVVFPLYLYL